jgi:GT2 family glycosyltransferase
LDSVALQSLLPDEILVIDGSPDDITSNLIKRQNLSVLKYYKVGEKDRGLTKQRNYGIRRTDKEIELISFLDDDIILEPDYFEKLITTYSDYPDAIGIGGYISNEVRWNRITAEADFTEFKMDGYIRKLGSRHLLRKKLGLLSECPPGVMPEFSNGFSIGFLPPSGKTYPVEFFMGGAASYRKDIFEKLEFSDYFQGYGLYEDMDFCLRAGKYGKLYVNTSAKLYHFHEISGRPDYFKYGKMVINNGWYVWRLKYPTPSLKARIKWNATAVLLIIVRLSNIFTAKNRNEAFGDAAGRIIALTSLAFNKRKLK